MWAKMLQRKVFFGQANTAYSSSDFAYFQENGWELMFSLSLAQTTNLPACVASAGASAAMLHDAGFDFWVDLEVALTSYDGSGLTRDTPISTYETNYGACMDYIEALPGFKGIYTEESFDNGIAWLNERSAAAGNYPIFQSIINYQYYPLSAGSVLCPSATTQTKAQSLLWRADHVNEMCFEVFIPPDMPLCINAGNYLYTNRPNMPFGIESALAWMGGNYYDLTFADYVAQYNIVISPSDRMNVASALLYNAKTQLTKGAFDNLFVLPSTIPWTSSSDLYHDLSFFTSLDCGTAGTTKGTLPLTQKGVTPVYLGASQCFEYGATAPVQTHPPDTFANTGNELIMLKNAGSGSTTHTITVSGTLPNGLTKTQNYTLTLSPNQGTPIGPYPVDLFGFNPTITYDTTNLYILVYKKLSKYN